MDLWKQINSENRSRRNAAVFRTTSLLVIVLSLPAICYLTLNKLVVPDNELVFTNSPREGSERSGSIEIVRGEETQSESEDSGTEGGIPVKDNLPRINFTKIENPTPSFEKYAYISGDLLMYEDGIIRVNQDAIGSKNIKRHSIERDDIDGNSITSGKIRNNSILGKDINRETEITVAEVIADDLTAQNLVIAESIDLGTNQISDGMFAGDWNFGSGDITTSGTISGSFAGAFAPSGDVDMTNHVFTNIGNAGTDFDSSGGLNLAGNLVADGSLSGTTLNTGQGNYELYAMDQNVLTTSSPTFSGMILNGDLDLGSNSIAISHTTLISNLNADLLDGNHASYFLNTSTNFGGDVSGIYNAISVSDDSHSHTASTLPALTSYLGNYIESSEITDNTVTTSDLSLSLGLLSGQSLDYGLGTLTANALNTALTYGVSISGNAATVTNGIYTSTVFGGDASGTYNNLQISGLAAADFTSQNVSQWTNDSSYITASGTITGLVQSTAAGNSYFTGGNVGIGTTSPTDKIDVLGSLSSGGNITIRSSSTAGGLSLIPNSSHSYITNNAYYDGGWQQRDLSAGIGAVRLEFNQSGGIKFSNTYDARSNPITWNDRFYISYAGNVGIGTASPGTLLDVTGSNPSIRITDTRDLASWIPGDKVGGIEFYSNDSSGNWPAIGASIDYVAAVDSATYPLGAIQFKISDTAGTLNNAMIINRNGNVGIGTTSPSSLLDLRSDTVSNMVWGNVDRSKSGKVSYSDSGNSIVIGADSSTDLALISNNTEIVRITTGGNVGIGTTSPNVSLRVNSLTDGINGVTINNTSTGASGATRIWIANDGEGDAYTLYSAGTPSYWAVGVDNSDSDKFKIAKTSALGTANDVLTIDSSGNVGIGTTSPGAKLNITSDSAANDYNLFRINGTGGTVNYLDAIQQASGNYRWTTFKLGHYDGASLTYPIQLATRNTDTIIDPINADILLAPSNNGNVGIGTTSPSQKFVVYGNGDGNSGITVSSSYGYRTTYLASDGSLNFNNGTNVGFLNSSGTWIDASDVAYKKNIVDMENYGLDTVLQMRPREYEMKSGSTPQIGFIAQEMETLIPEVVSGQKGRKGIAYGQITSVLTKAIQELASTTKEQEEDIVEITDNITTLEDIKNLMDKNTRVFEEAIGDLDKSVLDISDRTNTLEEQMAKIQFQNSEEGIGLIETRLGNLEIALNIADSNVNVLGSLSVAGDVDLLSGKLTAEDIEALGTVKAKNIEAEESVKGANLELGKETRGTGQIEGGDKSVTIETKEASDSIQIFLTPKGKYQKIYYNEDDIVEGKSFKVKIDDPIEEDIEFNWLIIK